MTPVVVPDVAGEILGWKALRLANMDDVARGAASATGLLMSPSRLTAWPLDTYTVAECHGGDMVDIYINGAHAAPRERCQCGIYAVSSPEDCAPYMRGATVLAQVALSGKVIPGQTGWRAERARVAALTLHANIPEHLLEAVAESYKVPVLDDAPPPYIETTVSFVITHKDGTRIAGKARAHMNDRGVQLLEPLKLNAGDSVELSASSRLGKIEFRGGVLSGVGGAGGAAVVSVYRSSRL